MQINAGTANSLAQKLTQLDLDNEEAVLLAALLADESEVSGFEFDKSSPKLEVFKPKLEVLRPLIAGPIKNRWIIIESAT